MRAPGEYQGLTVAQAGLLSYLRHQQMRGHTPSYQEMMDELKVSSKSVIFRMIDALEERGYAARHRNRARSIEVFPTKRAHVGQLQDFSLGDLLDELTRRGITISVGSR